ncbi:FAD-dependent oxidoreductase [Corynebacterium yudongzhengii]|uniref:Pyridine nucleotide-disulfide oxidoreductase domain-containing protein 2 n=1 Tax=Corynebacterium yudongzhengii TaxID=2080740 RepID=A0A2U1T9Z8_9CORY|nr:NAD(P)/FAD-dependent oxidoreductase [Corynebacterium yudongzhengii]AWB81196.1 FAD-dependent oxidoreductase [Corynebacterium yudongzhengii]PWC02735.1 NAD(P)/FAD-dependent oxidoreductase [Corynebacterium yudongzhengii]
MSDAPRACIIGAGPNGLTAAALLAREGWQVDVFERGDTPGGALRSHHPFGKHTLVDAGAAAFPFGIASPAFRDLQLENFGLRWRHPDIPMAHPLPNAPAALLHDDLTATAADLGPDAARWRALHADLVAHIDEHLDNFLGPVLRWPPHPLQMAVFGARGLWPATWLGRAALRGERARALLAGSAVHAITPPSAPLTGAFGLVFGALGMSRGWPMVAGGAQSLADALTAASVHHGVRVHTGVEIRDVRDLPEADAVIANLVPAALMRLRGLELPQRVRRALSSWRYGAGVFKVDFLLSEPVPWHDPRVRAAGTVHVGGRAEEIDAAERAVRAGRFPERPFCMVCQPHAADKTRGDQPVLWTYAHVPRGYVEKRPGEVAELIVRQIERFAPGFRDTIQARHETSPAQLEAWNPNLIGGDIAGGAMGGLGALMRPRWSMHPHRLGNGWYLASGATPPGAGVHGMCGAWAAAEALKAVR